jgi:Family of unknown function (DUF5996)
LTATDNKQSAWPELPVSSWEDTRDTLILFTQIVGKIRLALEPMVNQWWQVPFYVSAKGLTTSLMHYGAMGLEAEFDFHNHVLELRTSGGDSRQVELESRTVASFYAATTAALEELKVRVHMLARPVEQPVAIPFAQDEVHRTYDSAAVHRFWLALVQSHRVFSIFRGRFIGKASPVHFFWGAGDLAATRFSGRRAPKHPGGAPNCAAWVMELGYDHELSSCGFWPGGSEEGSFYSYAYPEPEGFREWPVEPKAAYFDASLGEFILPYKEVRLAADPDALLLSFLQSTYEAAAGLAKWDRQALEASWA